MLYVSKIGDYLKIFTDDEVKDLVVINFSDYFKSRREKLYSKLSEEQNFRKIAKSLYIVLATSDEMEEYMEMMQSSSSDVYTSHFNITFLNCFDRKQQLNEGTAM